MSRLKVIGLGNMLMADDGVGVRAIEELIRTHVAGADVEIMDGATLGLRLIPEIEDCDHLVLVDAINYPAAPGSVVTIAAEDVPKVINTRLSPHELGLVDLLTGAVFCGRAPRKAMLVGMVPERVEFEVGLSNSVEARLPVLLDEIRRVAAEWGHELRPAA